MTVPLRIILADDHAVVRAGLKALIEAQPEFTLVGEAADGPSALSLATSVEADVFVVDVSMPGLSGAQTTREAKRERPELKILALTVHEDRSYLRDMLAAGASGYVLKRSAADELIHAIRIVASGATYVDPALTAGLVTGFLQEGVPSERRAQPLSERESAVLRLIAEGHSNREIAASLGISIKTVETYKGRSMEKLALTSRADIVRYAVEHGWLKP